MNNEKMPINEALELFGIGRTTLYSYLKKLNITPKKHKNRSYLTNEQMLKIKDFINSPFTAEQQKEQRKIQKLEAEIEKQKEFTKRAEEKAEQEREKNDQLMLQIGHWQGRAKTLEEQNVKLLESQTTTIEVSEKSGFFDRILRRWKK